MKGIVLAGGTGSRLWPRTRETNKHLLVVHDRPMIHFPLRTLLLAGVGDALIVTTPEAVADFRAELGGGAALGMRLEYAVQARPLGLVDALLVGRDFAAGDRVAVALGDNLFDGEGLAPLLARARERTEVQRGATVLARAVFDPERYGVVTLGSDGRAIGVAEKPRTSTSNLAVTGLYFYDDAVFDAASRVAPSARGELEISSLNDDYAKRGELHVEMLAPEITWFDMGTPESLEQAASYVAQSGRDKG